MYLSDELPSHGKARKINIEHLFEKKKNADHKNREIFNKMLHRIHQRIEKAAKHRMYIHFTVPTFVFGEISYSQVDCIAYLMHNLGDNGFEVQYLHPNVIAISWKHYLPACTRTNANANMKRPI
jgi:hypothetical protein